MSRSPTTSGSKRLGQMSATMQIVRFLCSFGALVSLVQAVGGCKHLRLEATLSSDEDPRESCAGA
jgi:hypothetical protein